MTIPEVICAILLIMSVVILSINIIKKRVKKERSTDRDTALPLVVFGAGFLFLIVLAYRYSDEIKLAEFLQILLMFGLVTVTIVYAWSASRQASASVKMAEEMEEQRLSEAQPYLLLRLNLEKDELLQWEDYKSERRPTEFPVTIHNAGKGPAINLWAALWHRGKTHFFGDSKGYLAPNEEWQATISRLNTDIEEKEGWLPQLSKMIKENE